MISFVKKKEENPKTSLPSFPLPLPAPPPRATGTENKNIHSQSPRSQKRRQPVLPQQPLQGLLELSVDLR